MKSSARVRGVRGAVTAFLGPRRALGLSLRRALGDEHSPRRRALAYTLRASRCARVSCYARTLLLPERSRPPGDIQGGTPSDRATFLARGTPVPRGGGSVRRRSDRASIGKAVRPRVQTQSRAARGSQRVSQCATTSGMLVAQGATKPDERRYPHPRKPHVRAAPALTPRPRPPSTPAPPPALPS